jgi:ribosome-binding ATPase YchF (GTP1/OBG family)
VGLPNVGKSTLFNALLKKQQAYVANFPFATIESNVGIVPVPDARLNLLQSVIVGQSQITPPIVNATVEFVDIAGLIEGASKGEGLGNKFLSHIREVDAICYVLRAFSDPDVIKQGVKDPKSDFEILKLELDLADSDMVEKHSKKKNADTENLQYLGKKPFLVVLNIDEEEVARSQELESRYADELGIKNDQVIVVCAKIEAELAELNENEQKEYLEALGTRYSALDKLIQNAFETLGLITFLTAGEKEIRAWTIKNGTNAVEASGVIHTDFMQKFIKADVCDFNDFVENKGWKQNRELGKVRSEGRDYIVKDGDVIEFKIGT